MKILNIIGLILISTSTLNANETAVSFFAQAVSVVKFNASGVPVAEYPVTQYSYEGNREVTEEEKTALYGDASVLNAFSENKRIPRGVARDACDYVQYLVGKPLNRNYFVRVHYFVQLNFTLPMEPNQASFQNVYRCKKLLKP